MVWAHGQSDWDRWNSLHNYERQQIVRMYQAEQEELDRHTERCRIRSYRVAESRWFSQEAIDAQLAIAKLVADQLALDWSANRPPSVFVYSKSMALMVSFILGRPVEAIPQREFDDKGKVIRQAERSLL